MTPAGPTRSLHSDQTEFYNGELPYYPTIVTEGELNLSNDWKYPSTTTFRYSATHYRNTTSASFLSQACDDGAILLWYDEGSTFNSIDILLPPDVLTNPGGPTIGGNTVNPSPPLPPIQGGSGAPVAG
jgi:hypothetical protein